MGETDWEKLVLVLMGGAILSKSLIWFSVDGKAVFPSRFLIWEQTMVEVMKIMEVKWGEVTQSCPTLCDPMDCSPPGSLVHGIFQAWILEWVAIPFSRGSSQPRDRTQVSHIVSRCFTIWATREAPKIMGSPLKGPLFTLLHSVPRPCIRPLLTHTSPETPGHSQASLGQSLVGSLLLSPGSCCAQGFIFVLQESVSPVLCKFWWIYGRVNCGLFQEHLSHTQIWSTQSPWPCSRSLLTCISTGDTQTLKGRSGSVSVGSPGACKVWFEPSEKLCQVWGLVLNDFTPLTMFLELLLCLWTWDIFFWWYRTFSGGWLFSSEF